MDNSIKVISSNIRFYRKRKKLTQQQLGKLMGYSKQMISTWESGEGSAPDTETLALIAEKLGIAVDKITSAQEWQANEFKLDKSSEKGGLVEEDVRRVVRQEVRDIVEHERPELERILRRVLKEGKPEPRFESTEVKLVLPDPPGNMNKNELERWENNVETLERWSGTEAARQDFPRGVPIWAVERFCREAVGFYRGGSLQDVSGLLWDIIQEGKA